MESINCSRHQNMIVIYDKIGSSGGGNSAIKFSSEVRSGIIIKPTNFPGHWRQWKWILISSKLPRNYRSAPSLLRGRGLKLAGDLLLFTCGVRPFYFAGSFLSLMKEMWCLRCRNGRTLLPRRFQKDSYPKKYSPVFFQRKREREREKD